MNQIQTLQLLSSIIALFVFLTIILSARYAYWKGKYESLKQQCDDSGWESEAIFWRRVFEPEAAAWETNGREYETELDYGLEQQYKNPDSLDEDID